ncbi:3-oxoacyl-reductase [Lindgomyces ingoldianus]|uniref:3-oxoacyl-reductase n=1 Tax=Lindgomyces ingoldianus TaxID=673940 RepID=A0ACB6QA21_9PLEO|nr:3-oxoacyl-reductase [Lindgomyces ingoldianus]KAF2463390.1 3-oxoacyl-reductase [Lindgomyces ingoldianus]
MATPQIFANRVIAVTGAAQGIGLAVARYLAARGANLALADVKRKELETAHEQMSKDFPNVETTTTVVDVSNTHSVNEWIAETKQTFGKLDGAVNNAGILGKWAKITDLKDEDWQRVQQVNVGGTMRCLRAELKIIEEGGSIVNLSSVAGLTGFPGLSPYVVSKHAVIGLTRCAAKEAGPRNIRVNAICPGPIETPMLDEVYAGTALPKPPIARDGNPEEIASLVGYLLGSESKYTSGACIPVDGAGYAC